MRILIIDVFRYMPSGINYYSAFHLYNLLVKNGYNTDIIKYPLYENPDKINTIDFHTALTRKYDIIFVASIFGFEYVNKYIKKTKETPRIIIMDEEDYLNKLINKTSLFDFKTKRILKDFISSLHTDDICLTSNYEEMRNIREYFGINTEYIQPYIDEKYFVKNEDELKDNYAYPALFQNKLDFDQNSLDVLLKAVKYINNETDFLEKHNLLIDVTAFGKHYEKFVRYVYKNKLEEYFRFVNIMPNEKYSEYLKKHKFTIILPKNNNSHNRAILESLASGVPVLIDSSFNKHSDPYVREFSSKDTFFFSEKMSEIIKDTLNGFVFESGNYIDLADKIMLLSVSDLTDIRKNAFKTALKFKPINFDNKILHVVNEVIENSDKEKIMSEI